MTRTHEFAWGLVALFAVACGGRVIANGSAGGSETGGASAGAGGSNRSGAGGTGVASAGGSSGAPVIGGVTGVDCTTDAECQTFGLPCAPCPDGTSSCGTSACVGGRCVTSAPTCIGGSCNPAFCSGNGAAAGCCIGPNGPCGVLAGGVCGPPVPGACLSDGDCSSGPVPCQVCADGTCAPVSGHCISGACQTQIGACPASCNPAFCPSFGTGVPCCVSGAGPCGTDYGMGCVVPPPCQGCPPPPPPPLQAQWFKSCAPAFCPDAGLPKVRVCSPSEAAGGPCSSPGDSCALVPGCSPLLVCATYDPCVRPL